MIYISAPDTGTMALASISANRKYLKRQDSDNVVTVDINSVSQLPDKKEWIAEHDLQMLMLNG